MPFTISLHSFLQDNNITISKIQPDYCQKLNKYFQDNYNMIVVLNETSNDILEMAITNHRSASLNLTVAGYRYTCSLVICICIYRICDVT